MIRHKMKSLKFMFQKALRRRLENKSGTPIIIFLIDEQFAGEASPDRLLYKKINFNEQEQLYTPYYFSQAFRDHEILVKRQYIL